LYAGKYISNSGR